MTSAVSSWVANSSAPVSVTIAVALVTCLAAREVLGPRPRGSHASDERTVVTVRRPSLDRVARLALDTLAPLLLLALLSIVFIRFEVLA
jgi:hypothetical protein